MTPPARTALRRDSSPDAVLDATATFALEAVEGLSAIPKRIPAKYFYDAAGSQLFEQITALPEYYPTRTELEILRASTGELSRLLPAGAAIVEFGSGSTTKVRILLQATAMPAAYVPVDISAEFLASEAARLKTDQPQLSVLPVAADFTLPFDLPPEVATRPRIGFFPGSTIGNFEPDEAVAFLRQAAAVLGATASLVIGVDLVKDPQILFDAYNDAQGVTARFNRNMLVRMNRELGANFDPDAFDHCAFYDRERQRIEMHLVSRERQQVRVAGRSFSFRAGESIHTENSYKYTVASFSVLAQAAGWVNRAVLLDANRYFSVHVLECEQQGTARR
jgi:dimethylhistidine N-methyltransferase